jgi:hypothetical protein
MRIVIETIPHDQQRYDTVGDWQFIGDDLIIKVSKFFPKLVREPIVPYDNYEFLIGIHELIEAILCKAYGIKEEEVDYFDMSHENHPDPGSLKDAPYYRQHLIATIIEKMLASELGVIWEEYEEAIDNL